MKNTLYYLAAIAAFTFWGFFSLVLKPWRCSIGSTPQ